MSALYLVIAVALGILLGGTLLLGAAAGLDYALDRRRRRRRFDHAGEPPDALEAFGVDISMWPTRAPRNGNTEEASA